jgi:hypothetical protein
MTMKQKFKCCENQVLRKLSNDYTYCLVCGKEFISDRLRKERKFWASIERD